MENNLVTVGQMEEMLQEHNSYFETGKTRHISYRINQLSKLYAAIKRYETRIYEALQKDLGKSEFEAYSTEVGFVLSSISYMKKNIGRWAKPKKVATPAFLFPTESFVMKEPYGTVLIIGPFNYPFQLVIEPLIGAIAAGNCAVLKPSELTPNVAALISEMIRETFEEKYVRVIEGGIKTTSVLINARFDYMFFTGSARVGKIVMKAAANNLVPVTLELGGKSPVVVDKTANIEIAAKRIVWGKFLNAGQTCVAPDYILVHKTVKDKLVEELKNCITAFLGENIRESADYPRIVCDSHFDRLNGIIEADKAGIVYGGAVDRENRYIEPTIIEVSSLSAKCMQNEIFGPILPILEYEKLDEAIKIIRKYPKPLAMYIFTQRDNLKRKLLHTISSGGACINDTIMHVANINLPFGGVGNSGIGAYHGYYSYQLFTHEKAIVSKTTRFDLNTVYPPYKKSILKLVKKLLK